MKTKADLQRSGLRFRPASRRRRALARVSARSGRGLGSGGPGVPCHELPSWASKPNSAYGHRRRCRAFRCLLGDALLPARCAALGGPQGPPRLGTRLLLGAAQRLCLRPPAYRLSPRHRPLLAFALAQILFGGVRKFMQALSGPRRSIRGLGPCLRRPFPMVRRRTAHPTAAQTLALECGPVPSNRTGRQEEPGP